VAFLIVGVRYAHRQPTHKKGVMEYELRVESGMTAQREFAVFGNHGGMNLILIHPKRAKW